MLQNPLIGNDEAFDALLALDKNGRLPHAILLEGERGTGRFTFACVIAAMAVCRVSPGGCGECPDCKMALSQKHPDVEFYAKEGAAGSLTIKSLRTINQDIAVPPNQGRRRVVILRDIQDTAQIRTLNTLLKAIEEPPSYLMFILTADRREHVLPTILSRCLCVRMECPDIPSCAAQALALSGGEADFSRASTMAALTSGNVGRTLRLLSDTPEAKAMGDALKILSDLSRRQSYSLLTRLLPYERDRPGFRLLLDSLRAALGHALLARYRESGDDTLAALTPLQGNRLLDVIDQTTAQAAYNLNLPLTLTRLGARLIQAAL